MRDHVTEERISAYADGELEGDELKLVEDLLAESAEHRQLLAEFRAIRASLWSLPNFHLPADFHTRVVDKIDARAATPSIEPVRRDRHAAKVFPWGSIFLATASLAAAVAFTVMLRPATQDHLARQPSVGRSHVVPVFFQDVPKYLMVYDLAVTPEGQKNKVVDKLFEKLGIGIDPALHLSKKIEKKLMAIRKSERVQGETEATPYSGDPTTPKSLPNDKVEMMYIAATIDVLDQLGRELEEMRKTGKGVSKLHYDMVLEPRKLGVIHRLRDAAREHFAHNTYMAPADAGQAFRLSFHIELTSVSVPGAAAFPVPTILADGAGPPNDAGPPNNAGQILLIIRNVGAN